MEIELGPWKFELIKKSNYYHLGHVWCNDKEVPATKVVIEFEAREIPLVTVSCLGIEY